MILSENILMKNWEKMAIITKVSG